MAIIKSGTGNGFSAHVDEHHHLHTTSLIKKYMAHESQSGGKAFGISTPFLSVTTTGGRMLYVKNTSSNETMFLDRIWFNWDGGSTSHITVVQGIMAFGDTEPDTNIVAGGAGSLNTSVSTSFEMDVLFWDGVGNGMTGHTPGVGAFYFMCDRGETEYELGGVIVIGPGTTFSFNLKGAEAGIASINILGYMEEYKDHA